MSATDITVLQGSSPHMRGTRVGHRERHQGRGIIPAYAGNTPHPTRMISRPKDHPRICGEHDW